MKRLFALMLLLLTLLCCTCAGWSREGSLLRSIPAPPLDLGFRIEARGTRESPGDLAPAQVFELVRTVGTPVQLGRLTTSCGCIRLTSEKTEYAAGERIELTLHNVRPSSGHTYAFFVHVVSPVRQMLQRDVYVISDGYVKR